MGMVGRLSHHALVSRRRAHRNRPQFRRMHHWPDALAPGVGFALTAGLADRAELIEASEGPDAPEASKAAAPAQELSVLDMPLARLGWGEPFHWLALGWRDFMRSPLIGLFYGACFVAMGWVLLGVFRYAPAYTLAMSAGFLLMGPFLCLGLYQASRSLGLGRNPSFLTSLTAWRFSSGQLAIFATVLLVLEMLWGRAALIVFAVSFEGMPDFGDSLATLLSVENLPFIVTYLCVGGIFAGLIYAISVISMPMIMDRSVDAISAGLTSLRLVTTQPGVMLLWGFLITLIVVVAMVPGFLGLLVAGPVLGHASWHAYQAAMNVPAAPAAKQPEM
jgi:uncharacterized membrane protein